MIITDTYLSRQVFKDGGGVDGGCGSNAAVRCSPVLQVSVDTTHGELEAEIHKRYYVVKFLKIFSTSN